MPFSWFRRKAKKHSAPVKNTTLSYEPLEVRNLLATFAVVNLNDAGAGSLRQAIIDANARPAPTPSASTSPARSSFEGAAQNDG